jgi:hypothetical protein
LSAVEIITITEEEDRSLFFRKEFFSKLNNNHILNYLIRKEIVENQKPHELGTLYLLNILPPYEKKLDYNIGLKWENLSADEKNAYRIKWFNYHKNSISLIEMQKYTHSMLNDVVELVRDAEKQRLIRNELKELKTENPISEKEFRKNIENLSDNKPAIILVPEKKPVKKIIKKISKPVKTDLTQDKDLSKKVIENKFNDLNIRKFESDSAENKLSAETNTDETLKKSEDLSSFKEYDLLMDIQKLKNNLDKLENNLKKIDGVKTQIQSGTEPVKKIEQIEQPQPTDFKKMLEDLKSL